MKQHQIQYNSDDIRLDRYLKKILPLIKQSSIEEFLRKKKILIEGMNEKLTSGFRVKNNDMMSICQIIK